MHRATMFSLNDSMRYMYYTQPTDMRKSYNTLSGIVTNILGCDPCDGSVYIFMNKARNCIKLLHWESGGMVIYSKLLEAGTFGYPDMSSKDELAGASVLADIVIGKFMYHLPFYRQIQQYRFRRRVTIILTLYLLYL